MRSPHRERRRIDIRAECREAERLREEIDECFSLTQRVASLMSSSVASADSGERQEAAGGALLGTIGDRSS